MEEKKIEIANYLRTKVSPFITTMMEEMTRKRPIDILQFTKDYAEDLINKRNEKSSSASESSDQDDSEQLQLDRKFQQRRKNKQRKISRQAISAEVYGVFNKKEQFVPKIFAKDSTTKQKIQELIKKSILFANLSDEDKNIVIDAMTIQDYQQEGQVIMEGQQGDVLYLIGSGEYACSKVINGTETYLKTYKTGEYFGQLALMHTAPRAASIKCSKSGTLYALDRQTFKHIIQESATKKRQKILEALSKVAILSEIDPNQKQQICDIVKEQFFESGNCIVKEGEEGNKFYIIADGTLIAQKSNKKVYQFAAGDYFGEIALVRNTPRQATVKCTTKCHILSIERDAFKRMFGPIQDILKRNEDKYKQFIAT